jgi:hypothetical protein
MAGKFIIGNRTDLSDQDALNIVLNVVRGGRIFNKGKQYRYYSAFYYKEMTITVLTDLNKCSDRFVIAETNRHFKKTKRQ